MFKVNVTLVFLLLTLNTLRTFFSVSIVNFEQKNVSWPKSFMLNPFQGRFSFLYFFIFSRGFLTFPGVREKENLLKTG